MELNATFNYIVVVSFIGGGNRCTWSKLPICCKSLINFITILYKVAGFERTTLVMIDTDCNGSCKSNYHVITTTPTELYVTFALYLISVAIVVVLPCVLTLSMLMGLFHSASCHFLTVNRFILLRSCLLLVLQINL